MRKIDHDLQHVESRVWEWDKKANSDGLHAKTSLTLHKMSVVATAVNYSSKANSITFVLGSCVTMSCRNFDTRHVGNNRIFQIHLVQHFFKGLLHVRMISGIEQQLHFAKFHHWFQGRHEFADN
jgi:hypothetical protein